MAACSTPMACGPSSTVSNPSISMQSNTGSSGVHVKRHCKATENRSQKMLTGSRVYFQYASGEADAHAFIRGRVMMVTHWKRRLKLHDAATGICSLNQLWA